MAFSQAHNKNDKARVVFLKIQILRPLCKNALALSVYATKWGCNPQLRAVCAP